MKFHQENSNKSTFVILVDEKNLKKELPEEEDQKEIPEEEFPVSKKVRASLSRDRV